MMQTTEKGLGDDLPDSLNDSGNRSIFAQKKVGAPACIAAATASRCSTAFSNQARFPFMMIVGSPTPGGSTGATRRSQPQDSGPRRRLHCNRALQVRSHSRQCRRSPALHHLGRGGGWGDPLKRYAELVARELRQGLVTREGAARYGVMLDDELAVNRPETEQLRATCQKEIGLPAPKPPRFSRPAGLSQQDREPTFL